MMKPKVAAWGIAAGIILLGLILSSRVPLEEAGTVSGAAPEAPSWERETARTPAAYGSFLYGRVTTEAGAVYEGRLRWGGDEEAFWDDYFNGFKDENPWAAYVPAEHSREIRSFEIFGVKIAEWERPVDLRRPLMVRFGDIEGLEAKGRELRVTVKSGTVFRLDRFRADDFADGLRIWDTSLGVVDLPERHIRSIEHLPSPRSGADAARLHGTVHTRQGEITGFIQWNRKQCVGSDALDGFLGDERLSLAFDTILSITRESPDSSRVKLAEGRELVLSGTPDVGRGNRGLYVYDERYGRVSVPWDAFEGVEFSPDFSSGGSGSAYDAFPPGRPLSGAVITRADRRLSGRIVFDLDESETTETLDAPRGGLNYSVPFGRIASISLPVLGPNGDQPARLRLQGGEELELEVKGDLGQGNAGLLVFAGNREAPEYVPWKEVARIEFGGAELRAAPDSIPNP